MRNLLVLAGRRWSGDEWLGETGTLSTGWKPRLGRSLDLEILVVAIAGAGKQGCRAELKVHLEKRASEDEVGVMCMPSDPDAAIFHGSGKAVATWRGLDEYVRLVFQIRNLDPESADLVFAHVDVGNPVWSN